MIDKQFINQDVSQKFVYYGHRECKLTLLGFKVCKIPYHFADEEVFTSERVERFEMLGHQFYLIFFRPNERGALYVKTNQNATRIN